MLLRIWHACAAVLLVIAVAACGGSSAGIPSATGVSVPLSFGAPAAVIAASLPAVPEPERLGMYRIAASADASLLGKQYSQVAANAFASGNKARVISGPTEVSWALYTFGGIPGEVISAASYTISGLSAGEQIYIAIGDYQTQRWLFMPVQTATSGTLTLPSTVPGAYQSALGNSALLIANYGGDDFAVDSVRLTYDARFAVTGSVFDKTGAPVAGVTVASPVGGQSTVTNSAGAYALTFPNGSWPVIASLDGWTFYSNPAFATVAGADAVAPDITGDPHGARFIAKDTLPGNDDFDTAPLWDFSGDGPLDESLSADDDIIDVYRFAVPSVGEWMLQYSNPGRDILAPRFQVSLPPASLSNFGLAEDIFAGEVACPVNCTVAGQVFQFSILALGGGGVYSMNLVPAPACRIGLYISNGGADYKDSGLIDVTRTASGRTTSYFMRSALTTSGVYTAYDRCYPAGDIQVVPRMAGYTFTPASVDLVVAPDGSVAAQAFTYSGPATNDSFEPNDGLATATSIASLPYDSTAGPTPLQVNGAGDFVDYFMVQPPAGRGLRAVIRWPTPYGQQLALYGFVSNMAMTAVGRSYDVPEGTYMELHGLTDGNPYYISVYSDLLDGTISSYDLRIESYPAHQLQIGARVGGVTAVDGMQFHIYDPTYNLRFEVGNNTFDSLTEPRYVEDGSELLVECYRKGTPFDRQTRRFTMPASVAVLYFDAADLGADSLEPNTVLDVAPMLPALPATLSATVNGFDDAGDFYKVPVGDGRPYKLELTIDSSAGNALQVTMLDSVGATSASRIIAGPQATLYMPNDGNPGQAIRITPRGQVGAQYSLTVSNADAFRISGFVKNTVLVGLDGVVKNLTTGGVATSASGAAGAFTFPELLAPGSYDLQAYVVGYDSPTATNTAVVTTADVGMLFANFFASPGDTNEPNDTAGTAFAIMQATDYTATVGTATDSFDYYRVLLIQGEVMRFRVTSVEPWLPTVLEVLDFFSNEEYRSFTAAPGVEELSYTAPQTGNYTFSLDGQTGYTLRVDKMN